MSSEGHTWGTSHSTLTVRLPRARALRVRLMSPAWVMSDWVTVPVAPLGGH